MLLKWHRARLARSLAFASLMASGIRHLGAADFIINTANNSGAGSLRQAILDAAPAGDTASFAAGLAGTTLTNGGPISFAKNLQLNANHVNGLIITHDFSLQQRLTFNSMVSGEHQTLSGDLSGNDGLTKTGAGTLILSGNSTYTGGTLLEMGELRMTSNTSIGTGLLTVNNLGSTFLTFTDGVNLSNEIQLATSTIVAPDGGTTATLSGRIFETGGAWGLTKDNVSTLVLSGANTFTGGVYVIDGTVRVEHDSALGTGTLTLPGAVTLDLADGVNAGNQVLLQNNVLFNVDSGSATLSGTIEQGGGFTKTGAGRLILNGINSHTGGTTVADGILQGSSDSIQGDVTNNATVVFDQEGVGDYSGIMTGNGGVTKTGANLLSMTGHSTYTGPTFVEVGELRVQGSLFSEVTVSSAGLLSGTGTIGSVNNEGLIQPGDAGIGQLRVDGDFSQTANGQLEIEVNDAGVAPGIHSDHVDVSGIAAVDGVLNIAAAPGTYSTGTRYTVLSAAGGVSGTFSTITDNLSLFEVSAIYNSNDVLIELQRVLSLRDVGTTTNQQSVGETLDSIALTATGDLQTLINDLGAASPGDQQHALSQLTGEVYGTTQAVGIQSAIQFQNSVNDRLTNNGDFLSTSGGVLAATSVTEEDLWLVGSQDRTAQRRSWLQGFGTTADIRADGNAAAADYRQGGVAVGLDLGGDDTGVIGISNGHYFLSFDQDNASTGSMNSHHFGIYGLRRLDTIYVLGSANYGYSDLEVNRTVPGGTVQGSPVAHQIGGYAEAGISLDGSMVRFQPLIAMQYQLFSQQSFSEFGGPGALHVGAADANSLRTHLGGRFSFSELQDAGGREWTLFVHARWVAELLNEDRLTNASIIGAPAGGSFVTVGNDLGRHFAVIGAGTGVELTNHWSLFSNYDLQASAGLASHTGSGGFIYTW